MVTNPVSPRSFPGVRSDPTLSLGALDNLDDAAIAVDDDPVTGLDDVERIAIEIGDARHAHHHGTERNLRRHLVEDERLRCRSRKTRGVIHRRPPRGSLRAATHEHLVLEAHATQLVLGFGYDSLNRVDTTPA